MVIIKRYIAFFLCMASLYAVYSYVFDIIFCFVDFGSDCNYRYWFSFIMYGVTIIFFHFFISFPLTIFYNAAVNQLFVKKDRKIVRYVIGLLFGFTIGYTVHRSGWSFYIGEFRPLKNMIAFALTGLSVELLRTYIVKKRYENNDEYIEGV